MCSIRSLGAIPLQLSSSFNSHSLHGALKVETSGAGVDAWLVFNNRSEALELETTRAQRSHVPRLTDAEPEGAVVAQRPLNDGPAQMIDRRAPISIPLPTPGRMNDEAGHLKGGVPAVLERFVRQQAYKLTLEHKVGRGTRTRA